MSGRNPANAFEIYNAKNLSSKQLIETFVPTQTFWRMLSSQNQVIYGSRGSGKTAMIRMLAHQHLAKWRKHYEATAAPTPRFIGTVISTGLEWTGGLKHKQWQTDEEKELAFRWRLNVASIFSFLEVIASCFETYLDDPADRAEKLAAYIEEVAADWRIGTKISSIEGLRRALRRTEYAGLVSINRLRCVSSTERKAWFGGQALAIDLFAPLKHGYSLLSEALELDSNVTWVICIDEAEFLEPFHHRILNSHLRAAEGNVFFKIATQPYRHYTLATNIGASLDVGHDFEYVNLDADESLREKATNEIETLGTKFARKIFERRALASGLIVSSDRPGGSKIQGPPAIEDLLGFSPVFDVQDDDWSKNSRNLKLLQRFASPVTISRAEHLKGRKNFNAQIARKLRVALNLRASLYQLKGHKKSEIYCGARITMRCSDGNPRRMIRIFNEMIQVNLNRFDDEITAASLAVPRATQDEILRKFAVSSLERVRGEGEMGPEVYEMLSIIGSFFKSRFLEPLATDQIGSVRVDPAVTETEWETVKRAVGLGLLYPNINPLHPDDLPTREGIFRLAYVLAPRFEILPRKGKARALSRILRSPNSLDNPQNYFW